MATIEVKSVLTRAELETTVLAASATKKLHRNLLSPLMTGYVPPGILSYVVAYRGPARISTAYRWLKRIEAEHHLNDNDLPRGIAARLRVLSESVEGIFVLGNGYIVFDNSPIHLVDDKQRSDFPSGKYTIAAGASGNLLELFLLLTAAGSNLAAQWADLVPYMARVTWDADFRP